MQFFATVFFSNDSASTLTWISGTHQCSASMVKFSEIIPYPFIDEEEANEEFVRVRESG